MRCLRSPLRAVLGAARHTLELGQPDRRRARFRARQVADLAQLLQAPFQGEDEQRHAHRDAGDTRGEPHPRHQRRPVGADQRQRRFFETEVVLQRVGQGKERREVAGQADLHPEHHQRIAEHRVTVRPVLRHCRNEQAQQQHEGGQVEIAEEAQRGERGHGHQREDHGEQALQQLSSRVQQVPRELRVAHAKARRGARLNDAIRGTRGGANGGHGRDIEPPQEF
jgi:hypothetical protein